MNVRIALFASVALAIATPALAGGVNKMTTICAFGSDYCVYDRAGDLLGIKNQQGILNRQIGDSLYFAGYTANGLTVDLALFYASKDCSGQPLQESGYIAPDGQSVVADAPPRWAQWDGASFWVPSAPTAISTPQSNVCYGVVCNGNPEGQCMPYGAYVAPYYPAFAPAAVVETPHLIAPTSACVANQSCVTIK